MIHVTEKEVKDIASKILQPRIDFGGYFGSMEDIEIHVVRNEPMHVLIEISAMYEQPCECMDELLTEFASAFAAKNSEKHDDITKVGCDTCDYGSSYGFAIRIWS